MDYLVRYLYMSKIKKKQYTYLLLIFISLLFYAYADLLSSAQTGFKGADRTSVHIYLFVVIGLMTLYNIFNTKKGVGSSSLIKVLWLMFIWVAIVNTLSGVGMWSSLIHLGLSFWWIMSYMFFYNFLKKNPSSFNLIVLLFTIVLVFYLWATIFASRNIAIMYDRDFAVLNLSYYILVLIPFVFFIKRKIIRNILIVLSILIVVFSMKRGAIIILPLMFLMRSYTEAKLSNKNLSNLTRAIFFGILFIIAIVYIDNIADNILLERFTREQLTDGSGRREIYSIVINNLSTRFWPTYLIGSGSGSSVKLIGTGAHNEWLEFLYSFGVFGVILYFVFCVSLVKRYLSLLKEKNILSMTYGMLVVYILIVGLFGGFYFVHTSFYVFACIGLLDGFIRLSDKNKKEIYRKN